MAVESKNARIGTINDTSHVRDFKSRFYPTEAMPSQAKVHDGRRTTVDASARRHAEIHVGSVLFSGEIGRIGGRILAGAN